MSNPEPIDTGRSLEPLGDEEAIAIMEGRLPAVDRPETDEVALAIARGLLAEAEEPSTGAKVIELFTRQPWMRMAAAMVLGVAVASVMRTGPPDQLTGLASSNVTYLETVRSAGPEAVQSIVVGSEPFVSLIAYPDFKGAERLDVLVERAVTPEQRSPEAARADEWVVVFEKTTSGVSSAETLVVNLATSSLHSGLHRLRVTEPGPEGVTRLVHPFVVMR